jgi:hypothetical protein
MKFEFGSFERSAHEQYRSDQSNVISTSLNQQNDSTGQKRWVKSTTAYNISKSRYSFFLTIKNINRIYIYHWLFIGDGYYDKIKQRQSREDNITEVNKIKIFFSLRILFYFHCFNKKYHVMREIIPTVEKVKQITELM